MVGNDIFPIVGLHTPGAVAEVNLGARQSNYDIGKIVITIFP